MGFIKLEHKPGQSGNVPKCFSYLSGMELNVGVASHCGIYLAHVTWLLTSMDLRCGISAVAN